MKKTGSVMFVGAGPGDPKLLTIKGKEAIKRADVVVYDRLANPLLLAHAKPDVRLIYVGKEADRHSLPQEEINRLLVREAQQGSLVVRLKGGDPSIFGRVGEEAEVCRQAGIPFEIVPGITSGVAAPLYAGIPLTHREYNSAVAFLTGHQCEQNAGRELDWAALAAMETLVIYMGVKNLPHIRERLLAHGKPADTPVAMVRWGTLSEQQTLVGPLSTIDRQAAEAKFHAPAIIVIGEVVRLRDTLEWYETKPLFGLTVAAAAGDPEQEDRLLAELESLGADVLPVAVEARAAEADADAERLTDELLACRWLVFADERQVDFFFRTLRERRIDLRRIKARIAARGERTAQALESRGLPAERLFAADEPLAAVSQNLPLDQGDRVLCLSGGPSGIAASADGVVWRTASAGRLAWVDTHPAAPLLRARRFDWLAADDPYHLEALAQFAGEEWQNQPLLCVGEETAARARSMGWRQAVSCERGAACVVRAVRSTNKEEAYELEL
ncbi:uroporphyrinogen-III C-methyltransferase [Brevibacillus sp. NL20B1]|uniref:uroporphyrinogen-III C-methyltransferase n=1 Tax=Brevibacillus sp. NL20B1 TaxID=2829799 RepID=UPI001B99CA92|nr:uroporphyrinogen-III C-methyltransferase [Brevibacillus sp. NL20B1]MBR8661655.1 uroporphyrinogen-III C-methyltransferase [Brevibacillus sp. NL20B1]